MKNKAAYLGLLLAFALILSYIEVLLPLQTGIPGVKLGLANLAVLLCLYLFTVKEAMLLSVVKAVLTGLLFGNLYMIIYSLAGAVLSCLVMAVMIRLGKWHVPVVSAMGGVMHNVGQLIIAYMTIQTYGILYYVPILLIAGLITGLLIGMIVSLALPYVKKVIERSERV
ncbi:MAG: Gx transporter family protein [Lachnospiraceae bacterium]|nr:Gx transporter family protein [Lachnospiraceae bacterium]